ncbi:MAG: C40 family peptidase [Selenomonadaceae bacterium]|nr:C40 family peptidase [Selenomonadaceae bacterium]
MVLRVLVMVLILLMASPTTFAATAFRLGDQGKEVAEIQNVLVRLGYDVIADGDFGPSTVEAVKTFQKSKGMTVDGLVGEKTYAALMGRAIPEISRSSGNLISRRLINNAMQYLGTPYVFGGNSLYYGIDCSAYTQQIFAMVGISLPRTADYQFEVGTPVSRADLIPGDMVFFTTYTYGASHCGIYIGDGNFIHASSSQGVTISSLSHPYYSSRYIGARRMI